MNFPKKSLQRLINTSIKPLGAEVVRITDEQRVAAGCTDLDYRDLQVIKTISNGGEISLEEAIFLGELTRRASGPGPIVEIGTLFGWSTRIIVLNKRRDQKLYTADNYSWNPLGISPEAHFIATHRALAEAVAHYNVVQIRADKKSFYENYSDEAPELVFVDAIHSYEETKADIEWAKKVGAKIICGDDYSSKFPGVIRAVEDFGGPKELVGELFML
jgi:hypothetical protein